MQWQPEQIAELTDAGHHHPKAHVRTKALAVLAVARGETRKDAARFFDASPQSVSAWVRRFREQGVAGFAIAPGRGRPRQVEELLAQTVPSLQGFSDAGVLRALRRCGISYKRGQPWMMSPDPEFEKKSS